MPKRNPVVLQRVSIKVSLGLQVKSATMHGATLHIQYEVIRSEDVRLPVGLILDQWVSGLPQ